MKPRKMKLTASGTEGVEEMLKEIKRGKLADEVVGDLQTPSEGGNRLARSIENGWTKGTDQGRNAGEAESLPGLDRIRHTPDDRAIFDNRGFAPLPIGGDVEPPGLVIDR